MNACWSMNDIVIPSNALTIDSINELVQLPTCAVGISANDMHMMNYLTKFGNVTIKGNDNKHEAASVHNSILHTRMGKLLKVKNSWKCIFIQNEVVLIDGLTHTAEHYIFYYKIVK